MMALQQERWGRPRNWRKPRGKGERSHEAAWDPVGDFKGELRWRWGAVRKAVVASQ